MAKKRLSMFDAMDGALAKVGGLREAAEKVKTIPFRTPSGKQPQTAPAQAPQAEAKPADPQPETLDNALGSGLGNDFDNTLGNSTTPSASTSTTPSASTSTTPSTSTSTTPSTTPSTSTWAAPWAAPTDKAAYVSGRKAQALAHLLATRPADGVHIVRYPDLVASLAIPYKTIRWAMTELEKDGFFKRKDYRNGLFQGVELAYDEHLCRRYCERIKSSTTPSAATWATPSAANRATASTTPSVSTTVSTTPNKEKIDRENLSIYLTSERIALTWPNLHRSGFGPDQLAQIGQALADLRKSADKIMQSLDHAEWELEHDAMRDKDGQPVADPCSWVFTALSRTGYYRRPKGYVSPEEQAAKDAEAEAKAVTVARQAAEQAQFEAWRDGLSPDEQADAMRGHPGGPKDAWLKGVWKRKRACNLDEATGNP